MSVLKTCCVMGTQGQTMARGPYAAYWAFKCGQNLRNYIHGEVVTKCTSVFQESFLKKSSIRRAFKYTFCLNFAFVPLFSIFKFWNPPFANPCTSTIRALAPLAVPGGSCSCARWLLSPCSMCRCDRWTMLHFHGSSHRIHWRSLTLHVLPLSKH